MAASRCILHIGLHKTGSTSIQHFLRANRGRLKSLGIDFYGGCHIDENHVELRAATMRPGRSSTFRLTSGIACDEAYAATTAARIRSFVSASSARAVLFSSEGLSLLRYEDEVRRLASMLAPEVQLIVYVRDKADYLRSHAGQLRKLGIPFSDDPDSHAYFGPDTWLADYEQRLAPYRRTFGSKNLTVIDYDEALRNDGSVIPSFLSAIGVRDAFGPDTWRDIHLNRSA